MDSLHQNRVIPHFLMFLVCLAIGCQATEEPPTLDRPPAIPSSTAIHLAGAVEATALLRHLAQVFTARDQGGPIIVHDPLGSEGGLSALSAGVLTAALVTHSRREAPDKNHIHIARSEVVLALGPGIAKRDLSIDEFMQTISGEVGRWESGLARRFLLRTTRSAANLALGNQIAKLEGLLGDAVLMQRWHRTRASETLGGAVGRTPGGIALTDLGNLRLRSSPVWISRLAGVAPVFIDLSLVTGPVIPGRLQEFIDFVKGAEGQSLIRDLGFSGRAEP